MGCPVVTKVRKPSMNAEAVPEDIREADRIFLEKMLIELVGESAGIQVEIKLGERTTVFNVTCEKKCIGRIIGSQGKNISAVRNIITAIAGRKGYRAIIEIPYFAEG